jgi:hypothetical protein
MSGCQEGAMTDREVTMIEGKEILRLWLSGVPKRRIGLTVGGIGGRYAATSK